MLFPAACCAKCSSLCCVCSASSAGAVGNHTHAEQPVTRQGEGSSLPEVRVGAGGSPLLCVHDPAEQQGAGEQRHPCCSPPGRVGQAAAAQAGRRRCLSRTEFNRPHPLCFAATDPCHAGLPLVQQTSQTPQALQAVCSTGQQHDVAAAPGPAAGLHGWLRSRGGPLRVH